MTQGLAQVHFVDHRFAQATEGPDAGTVEIIYELDSEPDSMMSVKVPTADVPEGLRRGSKVLIDDTGTTRQITLP